MSKYLLFEIAEDGSTVHGALFNGELPIRSTAGRFEDGALFLAFDQYAARIEATYADGRLEGQYVRGSRNPYPFRAQPAVETDGASGEVPPSIDGVWIIPTESNKGEKAWRFIVRQTGAEVSGAILRVDGDTGNLAGSYRDGTFVMSHFSGARPLLLEVTLEDDGSLRLVQNRRRELDAPTDPPQHTSVVDPDDPFRFSFPDLEGRIVPNEDPRFAGKVTVVNITGSWCPTCHDEAPFLSKLYETYRDQGLEIVGLSFEEEDQLANPTRLNIGRIRAPRGSGPPCAGCHDDHTRTQLNTIGRLSGGTAAPPAGSRRPGLDQPAGEVGTHPVSSDAGYHPTSLPTTLVPMHHRDPVHVPAGSRESAVGREHDRVTSRI